MSGGDKKSSKAKTDTTAAAPQPSMTVQPFMPGMDQALAQQLAAGFGSAPSDFLTAFEQTYAPMKVPTNAVYTPAKAKTPAKTPAKTIQDLLGLGDAGQYRGSDR